MVNRVFIPVDRPLQGISTHRTRKREAIGDARFDLRSFFIIVPCHQLQIGQRLGRRIKVVDRRKRLQPSLPALLAHDAVRAPSCKRIVESLVCRPDRLLAGILHSGAIEARKIAQSEITVGRHHPGIAAIGQHMGKAIVILEDENRLHTQGRIHGRPINRIGKIDVEVGDHRLPLPLHIRGRRKISLLQVLQLRDQSFLRRTSRARVPLDRSLIDHDRKREAGMAFRRRHHQLCGLINRIARPIPIDDHSINPAADHVVDLALDLGRVRGTVSHVHMVRFAEPKHQVRVNLGGRAGIKQRIHINLADIARAQVAVRLRGKAVGGAGVVRGLSGKRRAWHYIRGTGQAKAGKAKRQHGKQNCAMHRSSIAQIEPRILLRIWEPERRKARPACRFPHRWVNFLGTGVNLRGR